MKDVFAITIGRQCGSGGTKVARELARILGIEYYDKELITLAAKKSGMSEKVFENLDEKPTNSLLYSLAMGAYAMDGQYVYWGDVSVPLSDKVYQVQTDLIKSIASESSSVFVGRCADYALREHPAHISVFLTDTLENRKAYMINEFGINDKKAEEIINKTDKKRANYYSFHTNQEWINGDNYDLCIRTSVLGVEKTAEMIIKFAEMKLGKKLI